LQKKENGALSRDARDPAPLAPWYLCHPFLVHSCATKKKKKKKKKKKHQARLHPRFMAQPPTTAKRRAGWICLGSPRAQQPPANFARPSCHHIATDELALEYPAGPRPLFSTTARGLYALAVPA
jgi:hypothetical protein